MPPHRASGEAHAQARGLHDRAAMRTRDDVERSGARGPLAWPAPHGPPRHREAVEVGGYTINATEYGTAAERLLLIHGLSGSSRWWWRNVPELAARYRVVIPDLIGFGRTPRPLGPLPEIAEVADLLAEWLIETGRGQGHVVGHSMGGQIAVHLAAKYPDRVDRLVLVDSAGIPRPASPRGLMRTAAEIAPLWRWGDPRFIPVIARDALTAGPRTLVEAIRRILRDDVRPLLERIAAPTLVIWGEWDTWVPVSDAWEFRTRIPDARLAVLRGTAHNPMVDRAADFNRLVLRFLEGRDVGR